MRKIQKLLENSAHIGPLPDGCSYCGPGEKLVLLITGKCHRRCFYCPLSYAKRGKEVIYANELKVKELDEIVLEGRNISAKGTGITGGDPMVVPELTLKVIKLLKSNFGDGHHIHLYTAGDFELKYIDKLAAVGLDELRFHPPISTWGAVDNRFDRLLNKAVKADFVTGAELPVLPGFEKQILRFARYLDSQNVEFLNLNELEFSESNWEKCKGRGYTQKDEISNSVGGSEKSAMSILSELASDNDLKLNVHYCSAQFKDRQQLTNRLKRRAKNVIQQHQVLTDDGTFLFGVIEPNKSKNIKELEKVCVQLQKDYDIPSSLINLDQKLKRIEIAPWVLNELKSLVPKPLRARCFIIEEYPTADRLEVERIPVEDFK